MNQCEKCGRDMTFGNRALFGKNKDKYCRFCLLDEASRDHKEKQELVNKAQDRLNDVDELNIECLKNATIIGINNKRLDKMQDFFQNEIFEDEEVLFLINGEAKNNSFITMGMDKIIGGGDDLLVTNERILISKRGASKFFSGSTGEQVKSFYYSDITTVDTSSLLGRYWFEITVPGLTHKQGGIDRFTSENVFEYTKGLNADMIKVKKEIQKRIREFKKKS